MGTIESTRKSSDPLYVDRLDVSSAAYKTHQGGSSIWTTDLETAKVLIFNTLVCIFVGLQLYHVKKNPEVLSYISLVMLVILTLGYIIPLVLDFEALCLNKQVKDKLTVSSRSCDRNQKSLWFAEEMTLLVIAFLYAIGAKITLLVAREKHRPKIVRLLSSSAEYQHYPICNDLKSYAGLLLDGFLLPQILLNMFSNSKQNALTFSFYVGTTFVQLLHVHTIFIAITAMFSITYCTFL